MNLTDLLRDDKTLLVCNHSGGKDSQAMYLFLRDIVPAERLVIIHADLPGADWPGIEDHIRKTTSHELRIVRAGKTFEDMVRHRQMFPSPKYRQCTSDLKRGPINKEVRRICNERGFTTVISATGIRRDESTSRSRLAEIKINKRETNTKRTWIEWLPIFDLSTDAVFATIRSAGQKPHWAYEAGMTRLSCAFCIMSSQDDLVRAALLRPDLLEHYHQLELETGHTMMMPGKGKPPRRLKEIIAARIDKKSLAFYHKTLDFLSQNSVLVHELKDKPQNRHDMTITLQTSKKQQLTNLRRQVGRLGYRLAQGGMSSSQAMTWAWATCKATKDTDLTIHQLEMIATFAKQLHGYYGESIDRPTAVLFGWDFITGERHLHTINLVTFYLTDGSITTRVVDLNWNAYNEVTGTGRPLKPGQTLMVDLVKETAGMHSTISTYENRILRAI